MSWIRLDAGYFSHPRVITAGHYAWQVHLAAIVLCKQFGWGGKIPKDALTVPVITRTLLAPNGSNVTKRYAEGLASCLSSGLIEDAGTHYQIRDWDQYQQDPLGVARQARFREKQKGNVSSRGVTEDGTVRDVTVRDVTGLKDNPPTPNGGGGSTSSLHEPQAARTPEPLSTGDRYAFEAIYRGMVKSWAQTKPPAVRSRELRATLLTPTPDADGIREFVTTYTPSFAEEVLDARRTAAMETNGRRTMSPGRRTSNARA